MPIYHTQNILNGGEISPLLRGRAVLAACAPLAAVFFLIRRPENRPSDSA